MNGIPFLMTLLSQHKRKKLVHAIQICFDKCAKNLNISILIFVLLTLACGCAVQSGFENPIN